MGREELPSEFEKLDADSIFKEVGKRLLTEKSRSLWKRMQNEMQSGSVRQGVSYAESELRQKVEQLRKTLNQFKEDMEK
jgi:chaperonin cofactor prefoldin